ncbi:HAD family hydrolase [Leeuwenhoekiella sp. LLG6367-2.1]|uniref:HAD family hydrolase n=1 Tax=Leeuwenhoekiella sp. LLG6367-2.1 TaxID=3160833 RepID=UPI003867573F
MIKYVFFDVSGTLLGKPSLFSEIEKALNAHGHFISPEDLKFKHKMLSEIIHFPDRTDEQFYNKFNSDLLYLLGIVPETKILTSIFKNCTYLPWERFEDTDALRDFTLPIGIISNFNTTLKDKIQEFFGSIFSDVFVSEELGVAKPNTEFYERALERLSFRPNEILYVGDSIKLDLEPAQKLGIKTLIIDRDNFYPHLNSRISSLRNLKDFI